MEANDVQKDFVNNLSRWLLGAAAVGGGARAAVGLGSMLNRNLAGPSIRPPDPMVINVPYKVRPHEEEEEVPAPRLAKTAEKDGLPARMWKWWLGGNSTSFDENPSAWPATAFGVPLAAMAGWKGVGAIAKWRRQRELQQELEDSKQDLYKAELGKFTPLELGKMSSDYRAVLAGEQPQDPAWQKAAASLDKLTKLAMEKKAILGDMLEKAPSWLAGMYGIAAPVMAAGTGSLAYNYTRNVDPERVKAKAIKDQIAEAMRHQSPSLMARLVPVDENGNPIPRRVKRQIAREEPERLAPGEVKAASISPELEERARQFVAQLLHS